MEANHIIPKKETAVAEMSTIISEVASKFFDEFSHFHAAIPVVQLTVSRKTLQDKR